jgi:nucleotide-binding universal stress UspA family protein
MDRAVRSELAAVVEDVLGPDATVELETARGDAAGALLSAAGAARADPVVVGSRGLGGFKRLLLGSVSRTLAEYSTRPVAIVRRLVELPGGPRGRGSILVGMDGSDGAARAVAWTTELAVALGAHVVAIHAFDGGRHEPSTAAHTRLRRTAGYALEREWCEPLRRASVPYRAVVADGDPRSVLLETARQERSALVVVGTRGLGRLSAVLLGSVASHVAERSMHPVVIVPPARR